MFDAVAGQFEQGQIELMAKLGQAKSLDHGVTVSDGEFDEYLLAKGSETSAAGMTVEQKVRTAAEQLVATALIKPILTGIRNDPFRSDLFHGGRTEEAFGDQLDTILADRIVKKQQFGLVESIYQRFAAQVGAEDAEVKRLDTHG